jgi:hypothetical protein
LATFGTFTSAVLTAAELNTAGGAWTTYTPTYTNFTLGNGTVNWAKYEQVGRTVTVKFKVTLGSTSVMGSAPTISLPATAVDTSGAVGTGLCFDASAGNIWPTTAVMISTSTVGTYVGLASGTFLAYSVVSNTQPFGVAWTTSDYWLMQFTYEAAADGT